MKYLTLLLLVGSCHVMAENFGNGTGWCQSNSGTNIVEFSVNKTITDTTSNQAGHIIDASWSRSGYYNASCDCDSTSYRGYNYFSATTGALTQKGTYSESRSYGTMDYYVLLQNKLEIGTEIYVAGKLNKYVPVPFSAVSNNDSGAGGCTGATMEGLTAGYSGNARIYISHPLVGEITIPDTVVANLYLSKSSASSGDNVPGPVPPLTQVHISGTIIVPQSCTIEAGQVIEVNFDDILGKDIKNIGDSPTQKSTKFVFTCSNVADGTNLSIALYGENDSHNNDYLKTTNEDIGIKITDQNGNVVVPNGDSALPINYYTNGAGTSMFTAAPVNTTGHIPHTGQYEATATLEVQIR
ncbi:fimbrial protein [Klebsiella sp. RHBSTW-00484]|nr:fimbrial protein [Klebsiella sp. RHBSTW-00465]QLO39943.1 fimbrial protein [Klebsiella sp. RHBSTW-00484]QLT79461.1 fimbrial protein [Klebsiella sp. RHBSTW-00464]